VPLKKPDTLSLRASMTLLAKPATDRSPEDQTRKPGKVQITPFDSVDTQPAYRDTEGKNIIINTICCGPSEVGISGG
jgi:hypothetical protein